MICPKCANEVDDGILRCPKCNASMDSRGHKNDEPFGLFPILKERLMKDYGFSAKTVIVIFTFITFFMFMLITAFLGFGIYTGNTQKIILPCLVGYFVIIWWYFRIIRF